MQQDTENDLEHRLSRFLKAELKRANVTYDELAERLKKHGYDHETANSIKAKLKRGTFSATFLIAALNALNVKLIRLEDI